MDREGLQGAKPVELSTVEELLEFQRNFETGFHFTDKEAEIIIDYFEGHDYVIGHVEGVLHRGDLADKKEEIVWEEYSMDDVIDLVCEWNYEFILDIDAERHNARDIIDFGNMQSRYDNLKSEEQVLDKLFDQTKYGKQVEELAVKLADELITNLSQGKDISDTVQNITTGFPKQEVSARAR